jgi:hypothetical protein
MYGEVRSESWLTIRLARNFLLQETDFVMLSDCQLSDELKALYATYRQKLRDLPDLFADQELNMVKFPISPEAYNNFYIDANPDVEYLASEDQWIALSNFFYTNFRDKMARYLMVRDVTDRFYMNSYIKQMKENPVATGLVGTPWHIQHQNLDSIKASLDDLISKIDNGEDVT